MSRVVGGLARLAFAIVVAVPVSYGYSVLTHEAIIDSVWDSSISKVLAERFPKATADELEQAHAYAYGGCIIQDMGYYPFSSKLFSDLTHYVRSGDFVTQLIREAKDLNEYAFALGALEHYAGDLDGHRIATNRAVPLLYPELRAQFGNDVTYWDAPAAHLKTEFGFDVLQVAVGRYAPEGYRKFIGFQVSRELLERAFAATYNVEMKDVIGSVSLALGTYRYGVRSIIPGMTRVAWDIKHDELQKEIPGVTRKKFLYNLSRSSFEKEWGKEYHKPGVGTKILGFFLRLLPGKGPLGALKIRTPTPEVEKLFMASFNAAVDRYKTMLASVGAGEVRLPNQNLDTASPVFAGRYEGADGAYADLLHKLADRKFMGVDAELKADILGYYKDWKAGAGSAAGSKKERKEAERVTEELEGLKTAVPQVAR